MDIKTTAKNIVFGKSLKRTLIRTAIIATILIVVCKFMFLPVRIHGVSMEPTYSNGSFIFVNRLRYVFREPCRGDIVAIKLGGPHIMYLKRIVGLPGETVAFENGILLINGEKLHESYVKNACTWNMEDKTVLPKHYYVVGDNRSMFIDEHKKGLAPLNKIAGGPLF